MDFSTLRNIAEPNLTQRLAALPITIPTVTAGMTIVLPHPHHLVAVHLLDSETETSFRCSIVFSDHPDYRAGAYDTVVDEVELRRGALVSEHDILSMMQYMISINSPALKSAWQYQHTETVGPMMMTPRGGTIVVQPLTPRDHGSTECSIVASSHPSYPVGSYDIIVNTDQLRGGYFIGDNIWLGLVKQAYQRLHVDQSVAE